MLKGDRIVRESYEYLHSPHERLAVGLLEVLHDATSLLYKIGIDYPLGGLA